MVTALHARDKVPPLATIMRSAEPVDHLAGWLRRGRSERFTVETLVTPEMARRLLEGNESNRTIQVSAVENYASAMRRGEWKLNGVNIIVAATGELNDGQHRLLALIDAGDPIPMSIQFGVERDSRSTVDVGRKRTLGDHFGMAGLKNHMMLAAVVRLAWCYDNNYRAMSLAPSVEQAFAYVDRNPTVDSFLSVASRIGTEFKTSGADFGFAGFVCSRLNHLCAADLLARIHDGLGLSSTGQPAYRVRERLLQHSTGQKPMARHEPSAVFIMAFNAAAHGRKVRPLSWAPNGPNAKPFPLVGE